MSHFFTQKTHLYFTQKSQKTQKDLKFLNTNLTNHTNLFYS